MFEGVSTKEARASGPSLADLPVEERLKQHIIDGERIGLEPALDEGLQNYKPLQIVNTFLDNHFEFPRILNPHKSPFHQTKIPHLDQILTSS